MLRFKFCLSNQTLYILLQKLLSSSMKTIENFNYLHHNTKIN